MPRYTNTQFLTAIKGCSGIIQTVADRLGCSWQTARDRIAANIKLQGAFMDEQEKVNDMAEATVLLAIKGGNTQDAKWWLARVRREKFTERQEVTGPNGEPQRVIIEYADNKNNPPEAA